MTNGDYIRKNMTDDHIALRFCSIVTPFNSDSDCIGCDSCPLYDNPKCENFEERLEWVKAEYVGEESAELQEIRDILTDLVKRIEKMEEKMS